MTFRELITEIEKHGAVAVDCKHFVVRNLEDWTRKNKARIEAIIRAGANPKQNRDAITIKKNAQDIYQALQDPKKIHPAGWLPQTPFSIYPLDI